MKRIFLIPMMAVLVCAGACKSGYSYSYYKQYDKDGNLLAEAKSKTKVSGAFTDAEATKLAGAGTNSVRVVDGVVVDYKSGKDFGADAVSSKSSAEALKAFGESVGGAIGEALSKAAK